MLEFQYEVIMVLWFVILFVLVQATSALHAVRVAPAPKKDRTLWWYVSHHILGTVAYPCEIMECLVKDFGRAGLLAVAGYLIVAGSWIVWGPVGTSEIRSLVFFGGTFTWFVGGYVILAFLQELSGPYPFAGPF